LGVPPLMHTPRPARRPKPNADSSHDVELLSTELAPHHFWLLCTGIMLFGILSAFASAPDPDAHGCQITQALGNHTDDLRPPPIFTCAGSIGNQALAPDEGMLPTAPHSELLLLLRLRLIPGSPSAHCPRRRARHRNHRVCTLPTRSPRPHRLPGLHRSDSCVSSHSLHSHYRHLVPAPGVGPCFRFAAGSEPVHTRRYYRQEEENENTTDYDPNNQVVEVGKGRARRWAFRSAIVRA
jgi:hypothetical protein